MDRTFGATVAQILVNLNEGVAIEPRSQLHKSLNKGFDTYADLLAALEATDAQINDVGRHSEPPDAYAEVPWEIVDQIRAAIAKAKP